MKTITLILDGGEAAALKLLLTKELDKRGDKDASLYTIELKFIFASLTGYDWNSPAHRCPELCNQKG